MDRSPQDLLMPAEAARTAGMREDRERQMRARVPELASATHRHRTGAESVRYTLSDACALLLIERMSTFGLSLSTARVAAAIALTLARRAFDVGASGPWTLNIGIRPRSDRDIEPMLYKLALNAAEQVFLQREWSKDGVLSFTMPMSALIEEFSLRAAGQLGVTVTPSDVLASMDSDQAPPVAAGADAKVRSR